MNLLNFVKGPLEVKISGPQGAGKTILADAIMSLLAEANIPCEVVEYKDNRYEHFGINPVVKISTEQMERQTND